VHVVRRVQRRTEAVDEEPGGAVAEQEGAEECAAVRGQQVAVFLRRKFAGPADDVAVVPGTIEVVVVRAVDGELTLEVQLGLVVVAGARRLFLIFVRGREDQR
jgi:hypothetical protein